MKKTLQCHSKGDKRFSALYAKVEINGVIDTIERWYQDCKRDIHGDKVGKGQPVDHIIWKGVKRPSSDLTPLYEWLWRQYFQQNPELLVEAAKYDDFVDIFKGKSINCQADVIKKLVLEYKAQNNIKKEEEKSMTNIQIIRSNKHLYTACIDKEKRDFDQNYVFRLVLNDYITLPDLESVIDNMKMCKILTEEGLNIVLQDTKGNYTTLNDGILYAKRKRKSLVDALVYPISISQMAHYAAIGCKNIDISKIPDGEFDTFNYLSMINTYGINVYYNGKLLENIIDRLSVKNDKILDGYGDIVTISVEHNGPNNVPNFKRQVQPIVLSIREYICDKSLSSFTKKDVYDADIAGEYYSANTERDDLLAEKYTVVEYFTYTPKEKYANLIINLDNMTSKDIDIFLKGWLINKYKGRGKNKKGYTSHTSPVINKMKGIKFIFNGDTSKVYTYTKKHRTDLTPIFDIDMDVQDMIHRVLEYGYYLSDILIDPFAVIYDTLDCLRKIPEQYAKTRRYIRNHLSEDPQRILNLCFDYLSEIPEVDAYSYIDMNVLMELDNEVKDHSTLEYEDVKVIKYGDYNLLETAINKGEVVEKK